MKKVYLWYPKKKQKDENLGHIWKWKGDVKQCSRCRIYLGIWDGVKPCV